MCLLSTLERLNEHVARGVHLIRRLGLVDMERIGDPTRRLVN